jgi:hypothetical protein
MWVNLLEISKKSLIYLASPYTHEEKSVRQYRYEVAKRVTKRLIDDNYRIFSPIVYTHNMANENEVEFDKWLDLDICMINRSNALAVLPLPGYEISKGVLHEVDYANNINIPLVMLEPDVFSDLL